MHESPYSLCRKGESVLQEPLFRWVLGQGLWFYTLLIQCLVQLVPDPWSVSLQCFSNQKINNKNGILRLWYCKLLVQSHRMKWCRARFGTQGISFTQPQPQTIILLLSSKWPSLMCFDTSRGSWHATASTSAPLSHHKGNWTASSSFLLGLRLVRKPSEVQK